MYKVREKEEIINIFITETLSGIKDIKLSSRENNFIKIFYKLNHIIIRNYSAASNWNLLPSFLVILFGQLSILLTALSLFIFGISGGELAAIMAIIVLVFSKLIPLLNRLGSSINSIVNINSWIDKVYETQESLYFENLKLIKNVNYKNKITWEKVTFSDVALVVPKQMIWFLKSLILKSTRSRYAFVGFSGSETHCN